MGKTYAHMITPQFAPGIAPMILIMTGGGAYPAQVIQRFAYNPGGPDPSAEEWVPVGDTVQLAPGYWVTPVRAKRARGADARVCGRCFHPVTDHIYGALQPAHVQGRDAPLPAIQCHSRGCGCEKYWPERAGMTTDPAQAGDWFNLCRVYMVMAEAAGGRDGFLQVVALYRGDLELAKRVADSMELAYPTE